MKILAIETSCDDTGVAILEVSNPPSQSFGEARPVFSVLSNKIASQIEIGKKYGGVYPMMAKREHEKNLAPTLQTALKEAKVIEKGINLIAVTNGPGLEPCLWVGVNFAKDLAKKWNIPIVPVNHIESHILVNLLSLRGGQQSDVAIQFPAIALVVSGGHTQLILVEKIKKYKILGETRDDAAGECFDKCAKILGLEYPGGPIISQLASNAVIPSLTGNPESVHKPLDSRFRGNDIHLPRPMLNTKDYDFSFSGLKTAVLNHHKKQDEKTQKSKKYIAEMAAEIQQAIIDVLLKKTIKAAKDYKVKSIILGGGVSANTELRKQFQSAAYRHCKGEARSNLRLIYPPTDLSTDNAVMTAITGYFHRNKKTAWRKLKADANLRIGE